MSIQGLRNEIDTIRCTGGLFTHDAELVREVLALREEVERLRPLARAARMAPAARPKSEWVVYLEAQLLAGAYFDREAARLSRKLALMEAGNFAAQAVTEDAGEKSRNDLIAASVSERLAALSPTCAQ